MSEKQAAFGPEQEPDRALSRPARYSAAGLTDVGRQRRHNEDHLLLEPELGLFVVADGMGGHNAGNVASALTTTSLDNFFQATQAGLVPADYADEQRKLPEGASRLVAAVRKANRDVFEISSTHAQHHGMGSTVVAIHTTDAGLVHISHVGDSRCYRIRDAHIEQLTRDHSLINEALDLKPDLTPQELAKLPRNIITRALGMGATVKVDLRTERVKRGDVYLLCSDGLSGLVTPDQILGVLEITDDLDEASELLVAMANDAGGNDNVTALLVRVDEEPAFAEPPFAEPPVEATPPEPRRLPVPAPPKSARVAPAPPSRPAHDAGEKAGKDAGTTAPPAAAVAVPGVGAAESARAGGASPVDEPAAQGSEASGAAPVVEDADEPSAAPGTATTADAPPRPAEPSAGAAPPAAIEPAGAAADTASTSVEPQKPPAAVAEGATVEPEAPGATASVEPEETPEAAASEAAEPEKASACAVPREPTAVASGEAAQPKETPAALASQGAPPAIPVVPAETQGQQTSPVDAAPPAPASAPAHAAPPPPAPASAPVQAALPFAPASAPGQASPPLPRPAPSSPGLAPAATVPRPAPPASRPTPPASKPGVPAPRLTPPAIRAVRAPVTPAPRLELQRVALDARPPAAADSAPKVEDAPSIEVVPLDPSAVTADLVRPPSSLPPASPRLAISVPGPSRPPPKRPPGAAGRGRGEGGAPPRRRSWSSIPVARCKRCNHELMIGYQFCVECGEPTDTKKK